MLSAAILVLARLEAKNISSSEMLNHATQSFHYPNKAERIQKSLEDDSEV